MQVVLLVIQLLVAVALIGCVLIQRTAQDGGGLMGGSSTMGGLFTARGSANLLTRATAFLATCFLLNCLALGYLASNEHQARGGGLLDQLDHAATAPTTDQGGKNTAGGTLETEKGSSSHEPTAPVSQAGSASNAASAVKRGSAQPAKVETPHDKAPSPPQVPLAQ